MSKNCEVVIFALSFTLTYACQQNGSCFVDLADVNIQNLITGIDYFTNNIMNKIFSAEFYTGNAIVSPLSIYVGLALLMFGANGSTQNELVAALGLSAADLQAMPYSLAAIVNAIEVYRTETIDSQEVPYEQVNMGQGLFFHTNLSILNTYSQLVAELGGSWQSVDFTNDPQGALQAINTWIASQTIADPLTSLPQNAEIILGTTMYLSAKWYRNFFDKRYSGPGNFLSASGSTSQVQTMGTTQRLYYYNTVSYTAVQLPYIGNDYTLVIVLPDSKIDSETFANSFTIEEYRQITLLSQPTLVNVQMPVFDVKYASTLVQQLKMLQLNQLFSNADLSNMIQNGDAGLTVSEIFHAAYLAIDENGTVIGGVKGIPDFLGPNLAAIPSTPLSIYVDHPFLLFVRHIQTNLIVHAGFVRQL